MTRRAAMFGATLIAAAMAGNTPVGAAYTVDTTGDGIPDAIEFVDVEKKTHALARDLTSLHGGDWGTSVTADCVMIFKKLNVYSG